MSRAANPVVTLLQEAVQAWRKGLSRPMPEIHGKQC